MRTYSTSEIRSSYTQKKEWEKQFPVSRFIFRPLSFPLASLFTRFTNSAPKTAYLGLLVGLSGSALLLLLPSAGIWPGTALLLLYALLDAVDGNIARVTGTVSYYGKFLDSTLGAIAEGLYLPCLGIGLYLDSSGAYTAGSPLALPPVVTAAAAFSALVFLLYSSRIEFSYDFFNVQKEKGDGTFRESLSSPIASSRFRGNPAYLLFTNLHAFNFQLILLCAAAAARAADVFLLAMAAYYAVRFLVVAGYYLKTSPDRLGK